MKEVKDLFSVQSATYAAFRPVYPDALYDFLFSISPGFDTVWDCGTGNGQVATRLSERFGRVYATDISEKQIENAVQKSNITYYVCRAEQTPLPAHCADMITIGTALHWFDFDNFYKEVRRVAKPGAVIAAWCYAPFRSVPAVDNIIDDFYLNIIGKYWDAERKYVDEEYTTIPFPFESIPHPTLEIKTAWTRDQFIGFLNSWSAVQHYIKQNNSNPVDLITPAIFENWQEHEVKDVILPLFLRTGIVNKQA